MIVYYLSNLSMGGGGTAPVSDLSAYPDPFASTVSSTVDPFGATVKLKGS
jgi:hypothetical protein